MNKDSITLMLEMQEKLEQIPPEDASAIAFEFFRTFYRPNEFVNGFVNGGNEIVNGIVAKPATKSPTPPVSRSRSKAVSEQEEALRAKAVQVLEFLNKKAAKTFGGVGGTLKPIVARLRDGYTVEQLQLVVARKSLQWANDPVMTNYLRPKTLFGPENFANYLGEVKPQ